VDSQVLEKQGLSIKYAYENAKQGMCCVQEFVYVDVVFLILYKTT